MILRKPLNPVGKTRRKPRFSTTGKIIAADFVNMQNNSTNSKNQRRKNNFQSSFRPFLIFSFGAWLVILFPASIFSAASGSGAIKGTIIAVAGAGGASTANPQSNTTVIEGAKLTLTNKATPGKPLTTVSNAAGDFIFDNLPSGDYVLTVEAAGLSSVTKEINLVSGAILSLEIDLTATVSESVTIRSEEGLLSTSETTTSNIVRSETLKTQPLRTDNFQNAISLTPGVVRDSGGNDYLKGTRAGQSSYTVNGADVTDPVTGKLAFDIPLEAAESVQIEENPYSAEFGRFTGGVINLQTKGGGDKFKVAVARFFPTFHNVFSTKVDSFRPRVTLSGPLIAKKLFFLQSFEYRFTRSYVPNLPKPDDNIAQEGFNSFTQLDWNINKSNVLKFNAAIFPQKVRNLGLDTFNPAATLRITNSAELCFPSPSKPSSKMLRSYPRKSVIKPSTLTFSPNRVNCSSSRRKQTAAAISPIRAAAPNACNGGKLTIRAR